MSRKGWGWSLSVLVLVFFVALAIRWMELLTPQSENGVDVIDSLPGQVDLRAYFPPLQGLTYSFAGEGMEYAAFTRQITFAVPGILQVEDLSGTNLVQVLECGAHELKIVWSEEEYYGDQSLLDEEDRLERGAGQPRNLVLLQTPLVPGHTWSDERFHREIVAVDEVITVPLGTFYDVVVVKNQSLDMEDSVQYAYYAKNVGLIKREFLSGQGGDSNAVVSSLQSLGCSQ
ncbi:MAG: hypothetical protein QM451_06565 [Bacillota bacterium]|jgi:hypothetical protein|nr:hypothetical protein [Bacillota bacterium]HHT90913.1 hypothetical protein [Bacillota bacterium]